jgi:uncharacterized Tic20 family protein
VPPAGGPPPGYPPGGYGQPGAAPSGGIGGFSATDEKTWLLITHFGAAVGAVVGAGLLGWVAPLIAMLVEGPKSPTVRAHAVESLNFQLTWSVIALVGGVITCGVGFALVWIVPLIFAIIGGIKATNGEFYQYPVSVRLIK